MSIIFFDIRQGMDIYNPIWATFHAAVKAFGLNWRRFGVFTSFLLFQSLIVFNWYKNGNLHHFEISQSHGNVARQCD